MDWELHRPTGNRVKRTKENESMGASVRERLRIFYGNLLHLCLENFDASTLVGVKKPIY
jgi:hypothetical protein